MMKDHWALPPDPTFEEKHILMHSLQKIYGQFRDPVDKLIISLMFEVGYPQHHVAGIVGKTEKTVSVRVKKIRTQLSKTYHNYLKEKKGR